jgi:hypothetical protein
MSDRYRPQFLWLLMGPVIGAMSGGIVGSGVVLVTTLATSTGEADILLGLPFLVITGMLIGGFLGVVAGFFAGLPFIFLVGRHLPRPVARRRAFALGVLVSPFAMLVMFSVVFGGSPLTWHLDTWGAVALLVPSLLGGRLAAWAAGLDELPKPVS